MLEKQLISTDPIRCQVWLDSSTTLTDQAIFLVRSGTGEPCFARVCTAADMQNYETTEPAEGGWYRVESITAEETSAQMFNAWLAMLEVDVSDLDSATAALEAATPTASTITLRRGHTGTTFGTLNVSKAEAEDCVKLILTVTISDVALNTTFNSDYFVITDASPYKLIRAVTANDVNTSLSSGEQAVSTITVYLNSEPNVEEDFLGALCCALEDTATFIEMI